MTVAGSRELVVFSRGRTLLEAHRVERTLSSDLVLHWSTRLDPYTFYMKCSAVQHEPAVKRRIEIVADDDIIRVGEDDDLRAALANRSLVRFNFADWSVIWLAGADVSEGAEIQALVNKAPAAMGEMIKQSITGFSEGDVERFLEQLRHVA